jgi:hypothetical protein
MLLVLLHSLVEKGLEALEDGELSCGSNLECTQVAGILLEQELENSHTITTVAAFMQWWLRRGPNKIRALDFCCCCCCCCKFGNGFAQCKLYLAALVHRQINDDISLCFFVSKQLDYGE